MPMRPTRTWTPADGADDDLTEDLEIRDRTYESFGEQGLGIPTYLPEPYEVADDPKADVEGPVESTRGAERVDLGEPLNANLQTATRLHARDEQLRELVCERLRRDGAVDVDRLDVIVHDGEVTLSGDVDDADQRDQVVDAASRLRGVVDVDDRLRIAPRAPDSGHGGR